MTATASTAGRRTPPDSGAAGPLAGELRAEISRLAYHLRGPATRSGITPSRLTALSALTRYPDGVRQGDLAELMNVSAPSMTRLVEALEEPGWVERRRDPADQRCLLLAISQRGLETLDQVREESATELGQELAGLSAAERDVLTAALPVLRKLG